MRGVLILTLAVAGTAVAADTAVYGRDDAAGPPEEAYRDGKRVLRWDNGSWKYLVWWYTGAGSWVANEFSDKTPVNEHSYWRVVSMKIFSSTVAPNDKWDGFNVALYRFGGWPDPKPTDMLWPTGGIGYFFKPSGLSGHVWVEVPIGWVTPDSYLVAAIEQVYKSPQCDPFAVDSNRTDLGHTWSYYSSRWEKFRSTADPYRNAMIRLVVEDIPYWPTVAPTSFGRVKALYR